MTEEALFALALEKKNAAERQALLDQACAGNAQLRAAVEGLLKASADAGSFLEHPPLPLDATVVSSAVSCDTAGAAEWTARLSFLKPCDQPDRIGKLISKAGEYEIIEVVGHGGMGAVLRAFDTKLSRVVAVKVMAPELAANPVAVKRFFLREATTAAAVHHEHVVTIHAVDDSHQPPYLVMQFVEGQTLQDKIDREGALELKHILRIGSQAAAGLAAAHKTGLIHRDVKPSNILLENGVERVKISDFGLARAADDVQMTQTGIISGTPQYMSPEQAKGEPIDIKSDLFSLGSVLYSMCTGRPAFRADNPIAVLRRVIDETPRPIHEFNAEIPSWLEAIVNKLLAKDPTDRFQSAAEVAELLGQHLAHVQNPAQFPAPAQVEPPPRKPALPSPAASAWPPPLWLWSTGLFLAVTGMLVFFLRVAFSLQAPIIVAAVAGLGLLWITAMACWSFAVAFQQARVGAASVSSLALLAAGLSLAVVVMFFGFLKIAFGYDTRPIAPYFVGLMLALVIAIAVWFVSALRSPSSALRHKSSDAKPRNAASRDVFFEHPVLGVLAIIMLLLSVGTATFLIMEALGRKKGLEQAAAFDQERIQGTWFAVRGERNGGQALPANQLAQMRMIFQGERVEVRVPEGQSGGEGAFELVTATNPRRIKITRPEGQNRFAIMDGIYELNGNHLRICIGEPEEKATQFKTRAGSRLTVIDFERPSAPSGTIILPPNPDHNVAASGRSWLDYLSKMPGATIVDPTHPPSANAGSSSSAPASAPLAITPFDEKTAKANQDAWAKHLGVPVEVSNSIGMSLRLIPPGKGASRPNGLAQSSDPFFLGTSEVTVGQFRRFVDETKYQTAVEKNQLGGVKVQSAKGSDRQPEYVWNHPDFASSDDHPVSLITWHDAAAFCEWLSKKEGLTYRLPHSDEWNWAARAGSDARFYFGDAASDLDAHAWILGNSQIKSNPVRTKLPNPWGLYDIYGNLWELSYDFERGGKSVDLAGAKGGPQPSERIYFWGGSFNGPAEAIGVHGYGPSSIPYSHTGFRVAIVGDLKAHTSDFEKTQTSPLPAAPSQTRPERD